MADASERPRSADGRPWPSLAEAFRVWARIALLSFGGPAGQIAVMHRILVEEKRWLGERRFLHALNFCMLLPGPEAQQLTVYIGWLMNKRLGGLIAGVLFVLPGAISIMALSWIYALYGETDFVSGLFFGLKAAVLAIVLQAVVRIGSKALGDGALVGLAALSFVAIFVFGVPFPLIILAAALVGLLGSRLGLPAFSPTGASGSEKSAESDADTLLGHRVPEHARADLAGSLKTSLVFAMLWLGPVALLLATLGPDNVFSTIAIFFSQLAVVTFGGAYAVLAYMAQAAVETHGWLEPGEMLDGLGMAETTPGPLIMVTQLVGFLGAFRDPGDLSPLMAGTLGGLLATWVTFTPCFLWIFLGAPHIERLRENKALSASLAAITAAVVGVILNLAIWFALHVLFREVSTVTTGGLNMDVPRLASLDIIAAILTAGALLAAFRFKVGVFPLLLAAGLCGLALTFLGLVST